MMKKKKLYLAGAAAVIVIIAVALIAGLSSGKAATIPVISLDGECLNDYTNWNDKSTYYPAALTFQDGRKSFTMDIEIKPQGTSSLAYPKKNFTVKFTEGVEFVEKWGAQKKYVLKADYIDPTNSCNVVSAKLAAQMNEKYGVLTDTPNNGVIDGFPVAVKINGEDAGTFSLTIPKDAWMLGMDDSNPNHLLLACEGWTSACAMYSDDIDFEADWSFEVGEATEESMAAFTRMVRFVATADDETFVREFDQYLDLDACINYICFVNASYAVDNVTKNMLMATYDGKVWYPILYDLDTLWGIDWTGTGLSEEYHTNKDALLTDGNNLLSRVTRLFGDQVQARYDELRQGILSREHIIETFEAYTAQIPQENYDINNALWYPDGTHIRSINLMSQLMEEYLPLMDANMLAATSGVPAEPTAPLEAADQTYLPTGGDGSLEALLATASELTMIVDSGVALHTSLVEWQTYLAGVQTGLEGTVTLAESLIPREGQDNAVTLMKNLLANGEAEADALLQSFGYDVAANMTTENRLKMLNQAAADAKRTEEEKAAAATLQARIEDYRLVISQLEKDQQTAAELNTALKTVASPIPDLVGAYGYANDTLYGILYRVSTLYQNIANYYASLGGVVDHGDGTILETQDGTIP